MRTWMMTEPRGPRGRAGGQEELAENAEQQLPERAKRPVKDDTLETKGFTEAGRVRQCQMPPTTLRVNLQLGGAHSFGQKPKISAE